MLTITLEDDNKDLQSLDNASLNRLLRLGKQIKLQPPVDIDIKTQLEKNTIMLNNVTELLRRNDKGLSVEMSAISNNITLLMNKLNVPIETKMSVDLLQKFTYLEKEMYGIKEKLNRPVEVDHKLVSELKGVMNAKDKNDDKRLSQMESFMTNVNGIMTDVKNMFVKNSAKGNMCENVVLDFLKANIGNCEIEDTSKIGGMGDINLTNDELGTICVECKNYSSNLPKREIDKFKEIINNGKFNGGILLNYNHGISNTKSHFDFDVIGKGKPILLLSYFNKNNMMLLHGLEIFKAWRIIASEAKKIRASLGIDEMKRALDLAKRRVLELETKKMESLTLVDNSMDDVVTKIKLFVSNYRKLNG